MLDEKVILDRIHNMTTHEAVAILREVLIESGIKDNCEVDGIYFEGLSQNEYAMCEGFAFTFKENTIVGTNKQCRYKRVDVDYKNGQLFEFNSLVCENNFDTNDLTVLAA